jgi:hypothetical protein
VLVTYRPLLLIHFGGSVIHAGRDARWAHATWWRLGTSGRPKCESDNNNWQSRLLKKRVEHNRQMGRDIFWKGLFLGRRRTHSRRRQQTNKTIR